MKIEDLSEIQQSLVNRMGKHEFEKFSELEAIELMLIFFSPKLDTRKLSEKLLKKFGSFSKILNAPVSELEKTREIDKETALYINCIKNFSRLYFDNLSSGSVRIYDSKGAYDRFHSKFIGRTKECVAVMLLNSGNKVIYEDVIWQGSVSQVPIYVRELLDLCVKFDAASLFLAHNHISGNLAPSRGDIASTREIQLALDSIYVYLHDHLILTENDYTSMRGAGWMANLSEQISSFRNSMLMDAMRIDEEYSFSE